MAYKTVDREQLGEWGFDHLECGIHKPPFTLCQQLHLVSGKQKVSAPIDLDVFLKEAITDLINVHLKGEVCRVFGTHLLPK